MSGLWRFRGRCYEADFGGDKRWGNEGKWRGFFVILVLKKLACSAIM